MSHIPGHSSLIKSSLNKSVADGIYNEIVNRYSKYYYFLGRTVHWEDELDPPYPIDSYQYELETRNKAITYKEIKPTDIAYVVPRYDWISGTVYDQYDDQYSTEVQGINLISGGLSYATAPNVYIGSVGSINWAASTNIVEGQLIKSNSRYYIVTNTGTTSTTAPTHTTGSALNGTATLQWVSVNDGNGSGATAVCQVLDGSVIDIEMTHRGTGYTSIPSVIIAGGGGALAMAEAVVTIAPSGAQRIEDAVFYVITDEFNVYKCLDNNLNAASTVKPTGAVSDPIVTADGYMWKFMYNVPIALRNKFLTSAYMPVVSALRNQFYSAGRLTTVRVDQAGSGYTSGSIVVQGDGYATGEQVYNTTYSLVSGGSGYNTPVTVNVDPPVTGVSPWSSSSLVIVGQVLSYDNNIYRVAISGTTNTVGPVHHYGIVSNGTAALEYIGTVPTASVTVNGSGTITAVTFYGVVRDITMVGGGSGYTSAPTVNFSGGGGTQAAGIAVINQYGAVIRVNITDPGVDFTSAPTVTFGTVWTSGATVSIGQQIYYSNRLYTVTTAGTFSSTAPVHSTGTQSNGTAALQYAGVPATATAQIKYGSGYDEYPAVTISGHAGSGSGASITLNGLKTEAKLIPVFDNGALSSVQIDDPGEGYSYIDLTVQGTGTGASASVDLSPGDINSLQANIELLTVDGRIMGIPVISGGYGYGSATVTIDGDGTGATATATLVNGVVKKINIVSYGQNYRWATATITGPGYGAKARVIIAPFGGHGKNAISNLYTRSLMFYSSLAQDKNQGFDVNNDYRQVAIVKKPRRFNSTADFTSTAGSACWVVSGTANTTLFPADATITKIDDGTRFHIVTNNGTALLLVALDNSSPIIGSTFQNGANVFTCSAVTAPTVDKYSGDLLFIDNRAAFTPTTDQAVTMRTVIKF